MMPIQPTHGDGSMKPDSRQMKAAIGCQWILVNTRSISSISFQRPSQHSADWRGTVTTG
jgi:hypothetical protein